MCELLTISYKDEEYSWEEWEEHYKMFSESLEIPEDFLVNPFVIDNMIYYDKGYSISLGMLREVYYIIASARFNLINSHNKIYDSNIISSGNDYLAHLWMRSEYLKNCILSYNSIEDYVYQMIWFAYELYGFDLDSNDAYKKALKKCNFNSINKKLTDIKSNESEELLKILKGYRLDPQIHYLREELSNNLKHRGSLQFDGLERTRISGYSKETKAGEVLFNSKWLTPLVVDIDETIDKLVEVHSKSILFVRNVIDYINYFESVDENSLSSLYPKNLIKAIIKKM